jgi:hypothetical protein
MGNDYSLQTEEYRLTILKQGKIQAARRHKAFTCCGSLDRVQGLALILNYSKFWLIETSSCRRRILGR